MERVHIGQSVLKENDRIAAELRAAFEASRTLCVNVISSPGAGKTSILEQTLHLLAHRPWKVAVLTGDVQTDRDAARLERYGFPALQITTGGACHLDAAMVQRALGRLPDAARDLLLIENVGNLVCPASYDLGEHVKVVLLSVAEGDDKPLKYPAIFRRAGLMIIHKVDLLPYTSFSVDAAVADARRVNPEIEVIQTSCVGSPGIEPWLAWLERRLESYRASSQV